MHLYRARSNTLVLCTEVLCTKVYRARGTRPADVPQLQFKRYQSSRSLHDDQEYEESLWGFRSYRSAPPKRELIASSSSRACILTAATEPQQYHQLACKHTLVLHPPRLRLQPENLATLHSSSYVPQATPLSIRHSQSLFSCACDLTQRLYYCNLKHLCFRPSQDGSHNWTLCLKHAPSWLSCTRSSL
ncbi:UNVERIFIED_CONTAM: hypothetical protein FKN15_015487 [Acipenser sinensis]